VKFQVNRRTNPNLDKYPNQDLNLVKAFSRKLQTEFGDFLKGIVLFGSSARKDISERSDIDVLVVVDDLSIRMTREVIEAYKIIVEKTIAKVSTKLHVTSLTMTSFWEYARAGDPVAVNMLRDGVAIIDSGFFNPLQSLLIQGRIRPSKESIWSYFGRSPRTLLNSKWHLNQATLDLYWAVIDAAHSALMKEGEIPPSPEHVADLLEEKLVKNKLLEKKYILTMRKFYKIMKGITHREIKEVTGKEFDAYLKEAEEFVSRMQKYIEG